MTTFPAHDERRTSQRRSPGPRGPVAVLRAAVLLAGMSLSVSSCASPLTLPFAPGSSAADSGSATTRPRSDVRHAVVNDARQEVDRLRRLSHEDDVGTASLIGKRGPQHGRIEQVGHEVERVAGPTGPGYAVSHPLDPRVPLPPPAVVVPVAAGLRALPFGAYPEEYLCDGGDSGLPVHYDALQQWQGLEPEDTIAEYFDHAGNRLVKPTNRVCVYAPRFAAVRSASEPLVDYAVDRAAGAHEGTALAGLHRRLAPDLEQQTDQARGLAMRSRASGTSADATDGALHHALRHRDHVKVINTYQDLAFVSDGQFHRAEEPYLAYGIHSAGTWTRDLNPLIMARDTAGHEVAARFVAAEYVGAEDRRTPGELRIVKLADKGVAHPGDVVTFTIRFDNLGGRELREVRIVDHLTPRLEYVPGSALTELEGRLVVEESDDGTQVLVFELDQPLAGGAGGAITFQTLVK